MTHNTDQPFRLLDLPPELREIIYKHMAERSINVEYMLIDWTRYSQPPILKVCRQLREEVSPFFYEAEEWGFFVRAMDLDSFPHSGHWLFNKAKPEQLALCPGGLLKWESVKRWLKWYHQRGVEPIGFNPSTGESWEVEQLFKVAKELKDSPWEVTERVLETVKECLEKDREEPIFDWDEGSDEDDY